jgi:hypothetical protein
MKVSEVLYKYDQVMEYHRLLKIMVINDLRIRIRKKGSREIKRRRERSARWKFKAAVTSWKLSKFLRNPDI